MRTARPNYIVATTTHTGLRGCHNDVVEWAAGKSSRTRRRRARPRDGERCETRQGVRAGKSVLFVFRRRPGRRGGALAQWQSSGLLTHWFRVRPPGAPPAETWLLDCLMWHGLWHECP